MTAVLKDRLTDLLINRFGIPEAELRDDARLTDLDLDSLALVELGMVVENEFGVKIREDDVSPDDTIAKLAELIAGKVGAR
ncbi:acyl carrier protein [Actinophytocola sediminis]